MSHANRSGCPRKVHREVHMTVNSKRHWGIDGQHVMVMSVQSVQQDCRKEVT